MNHTVSIENEIQLIHVFGGRKELFHKQNSSFINKTKKSRYFIIL